MTTVNTVELFQLLKDISPKGFEVSISNGILRSTNAIYLRQNLVYLFGNELRYEFTPEYSISISEFEKNYSNITWRHIQEIS